MKKILFCAAVLSLAACGVSGEDRKTVVAHSIDTTGAYSLVEVDGIGDTIVEPVSVDDFYKYKNGQRR